MLCLQLALTIITGLWDVLHLKTIEKTHSQKREEHKSQRNCERIAQPVVLPQVAYCKML